jgi:glutamate dehydrogenase (NAD(P)+)
MPKVNPLEIVIEQIDAVCERLNIDKGYRSSLKKCERELIVNFPVRMDDGTIKVFYWF